MSYAGEFTLSRLERVVSGFGKIAVLGAELDRLQRSRAIVVTGKTLGASPLLAQVTGALESRCVSVFAGARRHVPDSAVRGLVGVIRDTRADCLASFGGGSPIDMAKVAVNAALTAAGPQPEPNAVPPSSAPSASRLDRRTWPDETYPRPAHPARGAAPDRRARPRGG